MKPYPDQLAAVNSAVEHGRGIISMPTGTGKSYVIRLIIEKFKVKTLVIVPSLEIKKQMIETLSGLKNVRVENIDAKCLKTETNYDMLIIDESHHSSAKTYRNLNRKSWNKIYYRFFFTATPFRNDSEETILFESIAGDLIYNLSYKDAVKSGYIVPVEAYYIDLPKQKTNAYTYREVYDELVVNNEIRNDIISVLLLRLQGLGISTLCLVREVDHGRKLAENTYIPLVTGEDEGSRAYIRQFNSGGLKALIGTTGVLGEGIDTKPAEYVVMAGLGKAKSQLMQQIGRGVRKFMGKESCKIILFRDTSHKYLLRHFNAQKKILLDEYGVNLIKLDI